MSYLIGVVFDNTDEASQVRRTLSKEAKQGYISLKDSAIVVRDANGKIHIKDEVDSGVKVGALWGGLLGAILAGMLFPLFGIALGAIGGAVVGRFVSEHIDPKFIKEVGTAMDNDSSALFFIFRGSDVGAAVAAFRPYKGKIIQTTLPEEAEESLREELKTSIK